MQVIRAHSAGFCLGVSLALRRLDGEMAAISPRSGEEQGGKASRLITFGPIIHNPLVMRWYMAQGVLCEDDPAAISAGDRVVIRAHGVPREVEKTLLDSGAVLVDATCPKVKKAQTAIARAYAAGGVLLLFGEKEHPEVRGLLSYAGSRSLVFGSLAELEALAIERDVPYFLAAQTTQERSIFQQARRYLSDRLGRDIRALDTICDATRDRQREVVALCAKVQAVVVVGGFNSGNTRRLVEVAHAQGVPAAHVEQPGDITPDVLEKVLKGASIVGLTAGASTPEEHINAMQRYLEALP
jgi:4-hydroxy-3-methylbut-2-enyl diphosphate reductase